eukprot:TRINITY_DN713_c8_g1_i1.p1 TRINITY_DN713_c8_g1~~TRINITY_DN713_c8_g1_i1.p1  ORF type:complete len:729 (+),score=259.29 TRINITY_DN713_c8_g1_i1:46-2187(+)
MKASRAFAAAALLALAARAANPLGQVLSLLQDLSQKLHKEGEVEEKTFKEFSEWCKDAATNKKFEIRTATSEKEKLEATINKAAGAAEVAVTRISELASDLAAGDAELKNATAIREKEASDFVASDAELVEVIGTLGRAISLLEREMAKKPGAFAQLTASAGGNLVKTLSLIVDAASFDSADKKRLMGFVQQDQGEDADTADLGAPAAAVYQSKSGSIIDVLEDLKEKAEEQLGELRKAESSAKHNYNMLKQSLDDQANADKKDMAEAKGAKASAEETKAHAEGDLEVNTKALADARAALDVAERNCGQAAEDHEASVQSRAEELKAVSDAIAVLQNTSGGAAERTYSFLQVRADAAGAAGASALRTRADLRNFEVVSLLRRLAKQHHSVALSQLASQVGAVLKFGSGAGEDPFAKVKALISGLIERLESESRSEATEKSYCDDELAKTASKKEELSADASALAAKIDKAASTSATLKAEVQELQASLASLAKEQAELDELRRDTHAAYVAAKADMEQGLAGVRQALSVLREYYGPGSDAAAALVQGGSDIADAMRQPEVPAYHAKAAGSGSSVIGLLEVVESDFATGLAKEETQEADAAAEYEKVTQTNKVTTAMKQQDVTYKTKEAKAQDRTRAELTSDAATTDAELSAVLDYNEKLRGRCIAKPETYEQRKARRMAEIDGLKEALSILESEASLVQGKKRGHRQRFLGAR